MSGLRKVSWLVAGMVAVTSLSAVGWASSGPPKSGIKASALVQEIISKAERGDASAEAELGRIYYMGKSVPQDYKKAAYWFRKSADQGNAKGEYGLATLYLHGQGVHQNTADALKWTRKAANQGYVRAETGLGYLYSKGQGLPKSNADALKWYRKAAEQGFASAEYALGYFYYNGQGVAKDEAAAAAWIQKAAEQGDSRAEDFLGDMYFHGEGVTQNRTTAAHWYREAAAHGNADATYNLGYLYEKGLGVAENRGAALRLYRKAAAKGSRNAQQALGLRGSGLSLRHGLYLSFLLLVGLWNVFDRPTPGWSSVHSAQWLRIASGLSMILYVILSLYQAFGLFPTLFVFGGFLFLEQLVIGASLGFILAAVHVRWIRVIAGVSIAILATIDGLLLYLALRFKPGGSLSAPFTFSMANGLLLGFSISLIAGYWLRRRAQLNLEDEGGGLK